MTSQAKILANRRNAKKSTGPRTKAGKRRAAMNALKHGMTAKLALMQDEDQAAFETPDAGMGRGVRAAD